jgi:tetratricopeptide (TPR) repeat protein
LCELRLNFRSNEDLFTPCSDQNFVCIWYHDGDLGENIQSEMINRLKRFNHIRIFNDPFNFAAYLVDVPVAIKILTIITSRVPECISFLATSRPPKGQVYQFQPNVSSVDNPLIFTTFDALIEQIYKDLDTYLNENQSPCTAEPIFTSYHELRLPPPWSVWNSKKVENSFQCWKKESPHFFLFQALSVVLTKMKHDPDQSFADMCEACRLHYMADLAERQKIDDFAKAYNPTDAVWYYTKDSFLFRSVGKAFRSEDFEDIFKFRHYIYDLHWELDKLGKPSQTEADTLRLYRGKKLCIPVLQQLKDNKGALLSMNGFLSTTYNPEMARKIFAGVGQNRPDYESVLFEFYIDRTKIIRTYAEIAAYSQYPSEEEVLFSIGSVWRIDSVQQNDDLSWTVKLLSCHDVDSRIAHFFKELGDDYTCTLLMIGDTLLELGQYTKAENFYSKMLDESTVNDETRSTLFTKIGIINMEQGRYHAAQENFSKAERLNSAKVINVELQTLQPLRCANIASSRIQILNNRGLSYQKIGNSDNALKCLMEALKVQGEIKPIYRATVNDNIGLIYYSVGQYSKAFEHFSEAVKLAQNHASLFDYTKHYKAAEERLRVRNKSFDKKFDGST